MTVWLRSSQRILWDPQHWLVLLLLWTSYLLSNYQASSLGVNTCNCPYNNSNTITANVNKKWGICQFEGENSLSGLPWACSRVLPLHRAQKWPEGNFHAHPFCKWAFWCDQEYPQLTQGSQSIVIVGNINFLRSNGTPRLLLVAPPIKILPEGCLPVEIPSLAIE